MKSAPTVRTEFNAARRTYLDDVLNGINNPMSEVSSLFHFKGNVGRTSGATFPMKKNFAGVKVVGESITVLHYLNYVRKCKVLLDVDDCGAVALTNEEVKTIAREIRRRSRSKFEVEVEVRGRSSRSQFEVEVRIETPIESRHK